MKLRKNAYEQKKRLKLARSEQPIGLRERVERFKMTSEQLKSENKELRYKSERASKRLKKSRMRDAGRDACVFSLLLEFDRLSSSSLLGPFGHTGHGFVNCVKRRVKVIVEPAYQACHKTVWGLAARLRYGDESLSAPFASTRCSLDVRAPFRTLHLFTTRPISFGAVSDGSYEIVACIGKT
ncbi:MAG: hypothetical protein ACXV5D_02730 [Halobacteriota archaeon]